MSKKNQRQTNSPQGRSQAKTRFDQVESFVREKPHVLLYSVLGISLILGLLLFDVKPSTGGDDTAYILQAHDLLANGTIPIGFKSPGYPLVLALFMVFTGLNVILLKFTSFIFYVGAVASFYFIFRKRLEPFLFSAVLVFFAVNLLVLEYSHQTYSEVLFLLVELWALFFLWKDEESPTGSTLRGTFLIALFAMAGFYVRAIGATLPLSIGLWYILGKRWKTFLWFAGFCILLYVPWKVAEFSHGLLFVGQASDVMMVNPYNPALGRETLGGFVTRLVNNLAVHFNYMIPRGLQLPYDEYLGGADGRLVPNGMAFLGVMITTAVVVGIVRAFRFGSKELRFLALYFSVYLISICLALQNLFATPRMMVPMIPFLLLLFLTGIQGTLHRFLGTGQNRTNGFKGWFAFTVVLMAVSSLSQVGSAVDDNLRVLKANLRGDEFAGLSPDWENYLKASRWIARHLPKDSTGVICRKPELFQIYSGGFHAYGTYAIESTNPDTIVAHWQGMKMTHLLYDNFQWSTTLRRYVQPVAQAYPRMFDLIHQEGEELPSYVYRLDYAAADSTRLARGTGK
ncbi:MAG TPA: hypothetical protein VMM37_05145 [Bacteroidota bacterium]|nr:hypothetical protein [Bacteroidota bacterium]